jgi:hypothetical protein
MIKLSENYLHLKEKILISSQKNQNNYRIPIDFLSKKGEKKFTVIPCFSIRLVRFGNS